MILTSLIAVAFGTFGTGANGNVYYDNTISLSSGLVTVAVAKNTTTYSAVQLKCDVVANCDFRETTNEQGNKEYWVHFNSWTVDLQAYDIPNDTFNSIAHSTTYYNNFESSVVNDPLNYLEMYYYYAPTTSSGTISFYTSWYDYGLDENSGITISTSSPIYNSNIWAAFPNRNSIKFDLDVLHSQLINAFNMAVGGYNAGYETGYNIGKEDGVSQGYDTGYSDGYASGVETNGTAFTIFNGILNIGMIPVNFFLAMFNFNILGINISNFILSLISVLITIYIYRLATAKKE